MKAMESPSSAFDTFVDYPVLGVPFIDNSSVPIFPKTCFFKISLVFAYYGMFTCVRMTHSRLTCFFRVHGLSPLATEEDTYADVTNVDAHVECYIIL